MYDPRCSLDELAPAAKRACVMEKGCLVWEGTAAAVNDDDKWKSVYLGLSETL